MGRTGAAPGRARTSTASVSGSSRPTRSTGSWPRDRPVLPAGDARLRVPSDVRGRRRPGRRTRDGRGPRARHTARRGRRDGPRRARSPERAGSSSSRRRRISSAPCSAPGTSCCSSPTRRFVRRRTHRACRFAGGTATTPTPAREDGSARRSGRRGQRFDVLVAQRSLRRPREPLPWIILVAGLVLAGFAAALGLNCRAAGPRAGRARPHLQPVRRPDRGRGPRGTLHSA